MVWEIIKKQLVVFVRNPQQLFLLLILPVILIVILSVSLSSFMNGETIAIDAKVAIVQHENEKEQLEEFKQLLENTPIEEIDKQEILHAAEQFTVIPLLKELFDSIDSMEMVEIPIAEKEEVLKTDEYTVVIEVPENFILDVYQTMLLGENVTPKLKLYENEGKQLASVAVKSVLDHFQEQLTLTTLAKKNGVDPMILQEQLREEIGSVEAVSQSGKIGSKEYYTIGMAVMNTLFIASAVGSFAFMEKKLQVFNRIILANMSRWSYFIGIFFSAVIFSFIQLLVIYGFSWIVFGVKWSVLPFIVVTLCLAFAVGGVAVLLVAISYRSDSEVAVNIFASIIVAILSLLGGSFFPIGDHSDLIQTIGNFTPNGAAMTSYLTILREGNLFDSVNQLIYLISFSILMILIAIMSFPKRGQVS